jgi:hypothetical protein
LRATARTAELRAQTPVWKLLIFLTDMRTIKLSGREACVVRAIGFTNSMLGAEIQDYVRMESDDVTDALNSLMAAGFVESIPYAEQIDLAEMPVTAFEVNPAYSHELKRALLPI